LEQQSPPSLADRENSIKNTEQENIRRLREKSDQREREYQHQLNDLKQQLENAKKAIQSNINDDDIVEGRHHKQLASEMNSLKEEIKEERRKNLEMLSEMRLKSEIPNVDQVVNEKNLNLLKERYPHLYKSVLTAGNMYECGKVAHTLITEMRLGESVQTEEMIEENYRKPQVGRSGALQNKYMYDQWNMSPEDSSAKYQEALRYTKGKF